MQVSPLRSSRLVIATFALSCSAAIAGVAAVGAASAVKIPFVVALTTVSRWRFLARYLDAMSGAVVPHHYFDHVGERPVFTCWEC